MKTTHTLVFFSSEIIVRPFVKQCLLPQNNSLFSSRSVLFLRPSYPQVGQKKCKRPCCRVFSSFVSRQTLTMLLHSFLLLNSDNRSPRPAGFSSFPLLFHLFPIFL